MMIKAIANFKIHCLTDSLYLLCVNLRDTFQVIYYCNF